jgi:hypothetical protein
LYSLMTLWVLLFCREDAMSVAFSCGFTRPVNAPRHP